jgi:hypothetical protein
MIYGKYVSMRIENSFIMWSETTTHLTQCLKTWESGDHNSPFLMSEDMGERRPQLTSPNV